MITPDLIAVARDVIASLASHRQIARFSSRPEGLSLADAFRVTSLLRSSFEARVHGVSAQMWGYATDHTTSDLATMQVQHVKCYAEPRIEPEIMFGLKTAPVPGLADEALLECIDWVSLGYEVVQSIYPGWKFAPSDTVAANGLHGALLVGKRHAFQPRKADWLRELATFRVELWCNGKLSQQGGGSLVLGSPLLALRHLVDLLAADPHNPPLRAGEIISTGTLTLAMPVNAGETWTTKASGIPLDDISLSFA
jgi:2-oxo-3-hexenedioate decarboxylase